METQEWKRQSLVDLFKIGANRNEENVAAIYDDGQNVSSLTYRSLQAASSKVANELRKFCHKEVVGVSIESGLHLLPVLIGVLDVPAAFYTLGTKLIPKARVKNTFERLRIRTVITDSSDVACRLRQDLFEGRSVTTKNINILDVEIFIIAFDDALSTSSNVVSFWQDFAYAITTSGTTGIPKIVKVPHCCIVPNVVHITRLYGLLESDVVLQASPLTFDPSIVEIFTTFYAGATLLLTTDSVKMRPRSLADISMKNRVTVIQATPSLISSIAVCGILQSTLLSALSPLRLLTFGGEPCPNGRVLRSWRAPGNSTRFANIYGVTEVSSWATFYKLSDDDIQRDIEDVPLGYPLLGTDLELRDTDSDGTGQLWIGGEDRICLIDEEGPILGRRMRFSGDYARRAPGGALHYVGRKDDLIKRNGQRVHLNEIEKVVSKVTEVHRCVATYDGNQLSLFVQISPENGPKGDLVAVTSSVQMDKRRDRKDSSKLIEPDVSVESTLTLINVVNEAGINPSHLLRPRRESEESIRISILDALGDWLPGFSHPEKIYFVDDMPLTRHGKVDRRQLLESCHKQESMEPLPDINCSDKAVSLLTQMWKQYFPISDPDAKTFTEHGGNSLMALSLSEDIHQFFDIDVAVLFDKILHGNFQNLIDYVTSVQNLPTRHSRTAVGSGLHCDGMTDVMTDVTSAVTDGSSFENVAADNSFSRSLRKRVRRTSETSRTKRSYALTARKVVSEFRTRAAVSVQRASRIFCHVDSSVGPSLTPAEGKKSKELSFHLEVCWKFDTGKCVDASPLVVVGTKGEETVVYIGSHSHRFVAVNLTTGNALWEAHLGDRVESSACLSSCGRYVIVGCYDGKIYFLERFSGEVFWTFETGSQVKSSPCVNFENGFVYIGSHDNHLYALDLRTRSLVWRRNLDETSVFSSPLLNCETYELVAATLGGHLASLHPDTGDILWCFDAGKPLFSSPSASAVGYVVGCVDGSVYCVSGHGEKVWSYSTGGPVFSSPCVVTLLLPESLDSVIEDVNPNDPDIPPLSVSRFVTDFKDPNKQLTVTRSSDKPLSKQFVIIGSHSRKVYCLSAEDGTLAWERTIDSECFSTPFSFGFEKNALVQSPKNSEHPARFVAVCSCKGCLYILDLCSGLTLGELKFPGEIFSSPCVVGDRLVVGCRDDYVYCVKLLPA